MNVLITGSAGRVGRAIYIKLMKTFHVIGVDRVPSSTVNFVGDIHNTQFISNILARVNAKAIVHTAALHAPHVGLFSKTEFQNINVDATEQLALLGLRSGIEHFIFLSTTALYGYASQLENTAAWINENTTPQPRTVYHTSKIEAESKLKKIAFTHNLPVTVLQMSRCFPEPANLMATYRLTRGVDARDVATAHQLALEKQLHGFNRFIISGATPFDRNDCDRLFHNPKPVLTEKAKSLMQVFKSRGWPIPTTLDRVYDSSLAQKTLDWYPKHGFESVIEMLDSELAEVLPVVNNLSDS